MLAIFVLLTLGAGFVAMVAGMPYFWLIWVLGFAVVLPILGILFPEDEADSELVEDERDPDVSTDPLTNLRDQYVRGDLTDEEFERKLDRLLETESPENVAEWRELAKENAR
ncbi:hypothetical protein C449_13692 [Halococcus saccharolyticus DSM 5350]|uniref:SHOCT domain-containing protein n=2 Tax=Halococcus saccharolyticus TaxID=62319 RepID=M0MD05_9EURY|nr:hypothetical protein C449_13692 [Halococcus saccharolyticus DSM 5350]